VWRKIIFQCLDFQEIFSIIFSVFIFWDVLKFLKNFYKFPFWFSILRFSRKFENVKLSFFSIFRFPGNFHFFSIVRFFWHFHFFQLWYFQKIFTFPRFREKKFRDTLGYLILQLWLQGFIQDIEYSPQYNR